MSKELKKQMIGIEETSKPTRKEGSSQRGGIIAGKLANGKRIVIKTKNIEMNQSKPSILSGQEPSTWSIDKKSFNQEGTEVSFENRGNNYQRIKHCK